MTICFLLPSLFDGLHKAYLFKQGLCPALHDFLRVGAVEVIDLVVHRDRRLLPHAVAVRALLHDHLLR